MTGMPNPGYPNQGPTPSPAPGPAAPSPRQPVASGARGILRVGLWNYASNRWAPKNPAAKLLFEIAILAVFFVVLAVLLVLSQG